MKSDQYLKEEPPQSFQFGCLYCLLAYPLNFVFLKHVFVPWSQSNLNTDAMRETGIDERGVAFLLTLSPLTLAAEIILMVLGSLCRLFEYLAQAMF